MACTALEDAGPLSGIIGGLIAYTAATVAIVRALPSRRLRHNIASLKRENLRWFAGSGIFVAAAHGLFHAAVAVAPIMVVTPLMQLSLLLRILFSMWLNPDHEFFGSIVVMGPSRSLAGVRGVSLETPPPLLVRAVPQGLARLLHLQAVNARRLRRQSAGRPFAGK
jgi:hypothetical protein